jgi:CubicO group peptidase (beta-lactamase class C family)
MPVMGAGRFAYCNAGWSALDLLLRETSGRGFAQRLEAAGGILREPDDAARGHAPDQDGVPHEVPSAFADAAAAAGACWWATADELLDHADRHLHPDGDLAHRALVQQVRTPAVALPGGTVFDAWGKGWASWHRGDHEAFGWAGFTGGHRAYLRCFPRQEAALVVLTNCAGGLFGGPGGGSALRRAAARAPAAAGRTAVDGPGCRRSAVERRPARRAVRPGAGGARR